MLLTIVTFIIVLAVIIFVHELGHFITARRLGVKVEEFGFGFPPRIWGFKRGGTIYSINWIPLGGFVKIKGESGENRKDKDSFGYQTAGKRSLILSAGVLMNVVLAFVLLSIGFMIGLPSVVDEDMAGARISEQQILIVSVEAGTVAEEIGLKVGDQILQIDDRSFNNTEDVTNYIRHDEDAVLNLVINRYGEEIVKKADLSWQKEKVLGVYLAKTGIVQYSWWRSIINGFKATFFVLWQIIVAIYLLFKGLVVGSGASIEVAGPVGIAIITGQMAKLGFVYLLQFTALFSLNLAIINILPFPALDGGRLLFILIEKIRRKPNNEMIEATIHNIGFLILLLLLVVITYKDLVKYGGRIMGAFKGLFG